MSPLGKIPAYSDDDVGISDSSVILAYLDRQEFDQAVIDKSLSETIPFAFDYLEGQINGEYLVGDAFTVADLSVACMIHQFLMSRESVDTGRWPKLAAYSDGVLSRESFPKNHGSRKQDDVGRITTESKPGVGAATLTAPTPG